MNVQRVNLLGLQCNDGPPCLGMLMFKGQSRKPMIRFGIIVPTLEMAHFLAWLGTCSELRFLRNQINGLHMQDEYASCGLAFVSSVRGDFWT